MKAMIGAPLALLLSVPRAGSDERRIPFWPDAVPAAIQAELDGGAALQTVRELGAFHRVQGSPGFAAAGELLRRKLVAAGLADAAVERFPADGHTRYAHFRSYLGWEPVEATLEEVAPRPRVLERFPDMPVALADYSQDADVSAALVDVGPGTKASDYTGKGVEGKIVLADGPLPLVARRAWQERGALGFLSDFPNQTTAFSGDDRDLVRWGHLSPYETGNRFAFMISRRQAGALRERLAAGEAIVLRARVKARMVPASFEVVTATIPGTDRQAEEVVLTAHLCHQSAGANDNASGSAAIFEVARALAAAVARGTLAHPRRTLRFLWFPEISGSEAYLVSHPERLKRMVAGVHMDMVGGLLATTHGTFHLSRTAESLPHVANVIAESFFADVVERSAHHAERGGDPRDGLVFPPGSREAFLGDVRGLEMGSDHEVFEDSSFGIPMVYFHDWPDVTIHTQKDLPENLDASKLGRVAYLGAGIAWTLASLPESEAPRLLDLTSAWVDVERARSRMRGLSGADATLAEREAAETGAATLRSVGALWESVRAAALERESGLRAARTRPPAAPEQRDPRVPHRSPEIRGPLDVYYYSHLAEVLGADAEVDTPLGRRDPEGALPYEALNFADGRRTVGEIRDVLSGRYRPVPLKEVAEYFDLLAKAGVVAWK